MAQVVSVQGRSRTKWRPTPLDTVVSKGFWCVCRNDPVESYRHFIISIHYMFANIKAGLHTYDISAMQ